MQRLRRLVFESPAWKTFFSAISLVAAGVFASAFVAEISGVSAVHWDRFYRVPSFYLLVLVMLFLFLYNRALYQYESNVRRFLDNDYCTAYMRSQCLPEAAEKARQQIRDGDVAEFTRVMIELRKVLK